jgi:hypothetical protein
VRCAHHEHARSAMDSHKSAFARGGVELYDCELRRPRPSYFAELGDSRSCCCYFSKFCWLGLARHLEVKCPEPQRRGAPRRRDRQCGLRRGSRRGNCGRSPVRSAAFRPVRPQVFVRDPRIAAGPLRRPPAVLDQKVVVERIGIAPVISEDQHRMPGPRRAFRRTAGARPPDDLPLSGRADQNPHTTSRPLASTPSMASGCEPLIVAYRLTE